MRRAIESLIHTFRIDLASEARGHVGTTETAAGIYAAHLGDIRGKRLLEIGCGHRYPGTLLFASRGVRAVGIDLQVVGIGLGLDKLRAVWRQSGPVGLAGHIARYVLLDRRFFKALAEEAGLPLRFDSVELLSCDAAETPFPDATFDMVYSYAVFEHIGNLPEVCREMARVMQPGGIAYIKIHHWASLTGPHHREFFQGNRGHSRRIPPWDHLREERFPPPVYVNRVRPHQYREVFESTPGLHVASWEWGEPNGADLLTEEIRAELAEYTVEELTHTVVDVVLRRT